VRRSDKGSRAWDPTWRWNVRPVRVLGLLAALAIILVLATPAALTQYARWLISTDRPQKADVAIVLGGGEGERLGLALRIWREGRVPAILILDSGKPLLPVYTGEDSITQGGVKRRIAVRRGVPDDRVWLLEGVWSTHDEAVRSRRFLEERGAGSAIVVTSPFHSRRARSTFRKIYRDSPIRIAVETLPIGESQDDPVRWWTRERDQISVFTETAKILFYWNRFGVPPF